MIKDRVLERKQRNDARKRWAARRGYLERGEPVPPELALRGPSPANKKPKLSPSEKHTQDIENSLEELAWDLAIAVDIDSPQDLQAAQAKCRRLWDSHWIAKRNQAKHISTLDSENGLADDF